MDTNAILPVLDTEALQKKANEYAQKGAEDALKEFYTGYDSPYKKAITENIKGKAIGSGIEIPDIIGILNESISTEIDMIANNAVAKTYIPMIKKFLTRADAEIKLSDMLKEFIESSEYKYSDDKNWEDYSVSIKKDDGSFLYMEISDGEMTYEVHFHQQSRNGQSPKVYDLYTLPYVEKKSDDYRYSRTTEKTMKLSIDGGVTLEMPFTAKVLEDNFVSYIAKLIIAKTQITFDVDGFDDDMFPKDECHC